MRVLNRVEFFFRKIDRADDRVLFWACVQGENEQIEATN